MHAKLFQSCLTLTDLMDCTLSGSSVHGILQARILECVATPFSRGSALTWDRNQVSCLPHWQAGSLPLVPSGKPISMLLSHFVSVIFIWRKCITDFFFFFFFWEKFLVRKISYVFSLADFFVVVVLTLEWSLTSLKILGSALWRCHSFIFLHPALLLSLWSVSGFPLEMTCFIFLWQ